jgi:hypothetical protein
VGSNPLYSNFQFEQFQANGTTRTIGYKLQDLPLVVDDQIVVWKEGKKPVSGEFFLVS